MATLLDNVFIGGSLQQSFDSMLILDDTTDHLLSLVLLRQTKVRDNKSLLFESRLLNGQKLAKIKNELQQKDWNGLLNQNNCSANFDTPCGEIKYAMDKVAPVKTV